MLNDMKMLGIFFFNVVIWYYEDYVGNMLCCWFAGFYLNITNV